MEHNLVGCFNLQPAHCIKTDNNSLHTDANIYCILNQHAMNNTVLLCVKGSGRWCMYSIGNHYWPLQTSEEIALHCTAYSMHTSQLALYCSFRATFLCSGGYCKLHWKRTAATAKLARGTWSSYLWLVNGAVNNCTAVTSQYCYCKHILLQLLTLLWGKGLHYTLLYTIA